MDISVIGCVPSTPRIMTRLEMDCESVSRIIPPSTCSMSASGEAMDHANILIEARHIRLGAWIEKILRQARKSLTGMGVADTKDLTETQINAPPNLTGAASYPPWIKQHVKHLRVLQAAPRGAAPSRERRLSRHGLHGTACPIDCNGSNLQSWGPDTGGAS